MRSANFIGRVGALAVALGIGTAVAHGGTGIALADDTTNPTSDTTGQTGTDSASKSGISGGHTAEDAPAGRTDKSSLDPTTPTRPTKPEVAKQPRHSDGQGSPIGQSSHSDPAGDQPPSAAGAAGPIPSAAPVTGDVTHGDTPEMPPSDGTALPVGNPAAIEDGGLTLEPPRILRNRKPAPAGADPSTTRPAFAGAAHAEAAVGRSSGPDVKPSKAVSYSEPADVVAATIATAPATTAAATVATPPTLVVDRPTIAAVAPARSPAQVVVGVVRGFVSGVASALGLISAAASAPTTTPIDTPMAWAMLAFARRQAGIDLTATTPNVTATAVTTSAVDAPLPAGRVQTVAAAVVDQPPSLSPVKTGSVIDQGLVYTIGTLNGSDPEGSALSYGVPASGTGAAAHGAVYIDAGNNFWAHVATRGYTGTDSFTVTASDGVNTVSRVVSITVPSATTTNSPPVVNGTTPYSTDPPQAGDYVGIVRGHVNVTDPNNDVLTYTGSGNTTKGYVQIDAATGSYAYVATAAASHAASATNAAATGANRDAFTVTVSDGKGGTVAVPVSVTIVSQNTGPFATGAPTVGTPNTVTGIVTGALNVVDNEGDQLSYTVVTAPSKGQVVVSSSGAFTYTPTAAARQEAAITPGVDVDSFTISVSDAHGGITSVAVSNVTIAPSSTAAPTPTTPTVVGRVAVGNFPIDVTVSPDGKKIYVVNFNSSTISVIDAATGATTGSPIPIGTTYLGTFYGGNPISVTFNPSGTSAYVSNSYLETVNVINTATGANTGSFTVGKHPGTISFSSDGTKMYVLNFTAGTLQQYNTSNNTLISSVSTGGTRPMRMSLSADGSTAYVLNGVSDTVSVINTATMSLVGSPIAVGDGDNFNDIAVTPDGSKVYVTNALSNTVTVINTASRTTSTINVGVNPWGVAVSPDGSMVYVTNAYSNTLSVISTATNTVVSTTNLGSGPYLPISVTFSPDGTKAYISRLSYGSDAIGDVVVIKTGRATTV